MIPAPILEMTQRLASTAVPVTREERAALTDRLRATRDHIDRALKEETDGTRSVRRAWHDSLAKRNT